MVKSDFPSGDQERNSMKRILDFFTDDGGAELAEYAVAVALLVVIGVVVLSVLGQAILERNTDTGEDIRNTPRQFPF
jgi:Flp pilus assembly pilin Flp